MLHMDELHNLARQWQVWEPRVKPVFLSLCWVIDARWQVEYEGYEEVADRTLWWVTVDTDVKRIMFMWRTQVKEQRSQLFIFHSDEPPFIPFQVRVFFCCAFSIYNFGTLWEKGRKVGYLSNTQLLGSWSNNDRPCTSSDSSSVEPKGAFTVLSMPKIKRLPCFTLNTPRDTLQP